MQFFAWTYMVLSVIVICFQLVLAAGAPLGEFTLDGRFPGRLPNRMRIAALMQVAVLVCFSGIVASRSGLAFRDAPVLGRVGIWFVVAFFVPGTLLNITSPSRRERLVMGPLNVIALISALAIALS